MRNEGLALIIIEPIFFGEPYLKYCRELGVISIILKREDIPNLQPDYSMADYIVQCDVTKTEIVVTELSRFLHDHKFDQLGIAPGNDYAVALSAELASIFQLKSISLESAYCTRNKYYARNKIAKYSQELNPKYFFYYYKEVNANFKILINYPVIVKPLDMTSSINTRYIETEEDFHEHIALMKKDTNNFGYPIQNGFLLEEYIGGNEYSFDGMMANGECVFSCFTEKYKSNLPYFIEWQHTVPAGIEEPLDDSIRRKLVGLLLHMGIIDGPFHLEFFLNGTQLKIVEMASRMGGGSITKLIKLSYNIDLHLLNIINCLDMPLHKYLNSKFTKHARMRYLDNLTGRVASIHMLNTEDVKKHIQEYIVQGEIGEILNKPTSNLDRKFGFILSADSRQELDAVTEKVINKNFQVTTVQID